MRAEEYREPFERLILQLSEEVIGDDGEFVLDPPDNQPGEARVRFTSRREPHRTAGLRLDPSWLEAFFFLEPNVSILRLDDYADNDEYTTAHVRELVEVIHAYLGGEGLMESRRTFRGRRRSQIRFNVGGREWLAR